MAVTRLGKDGGIAPSLTTIQGGGGKASLGVKTRFGLDGGIAPSLASIQGGVNPNIPIGIAQETEIALAVQAAITDQVTRFGLEGGIAANIPRQYELKFPTLLRAEETDSALPVSADNPAGEVIGQASESNSARSVSTQQAAAITSVASSRGTDIVAANESLTVNVDDSTGITSVTINGTGCTSVVIQDATTVTCNVPLGVGAAPGSTVDAVVNNGVPSVGFSVTFEPPLGMVYTSFTQDWNALDPDSPFAGDTDFSDIAVGDVCIYDSVTAPDSNSIAMDGLGEFTIGGTVTQVQTFDYYLYDASDQTVSSTIEQITVYPGPVEAQISQASETDTAQAVASEVATTGLIGQATEADTSIGVADGSIPQQTVGQATEADSAQSVAGGPDIVVTIGFASETNTPFAFTDGSTPAQAIGQALEAAQAFGVTDVQAVVATISIASETDSAFEVDFPPDLNSLRDQIEALQDSVDDLTAIVNAQQALIEDLHIRMDLDATKPNTYAEDGSSITNSEFTLTKTDNGDGTFTITRTAT